ncbi:hypothetical protein NRIC_31280 [Enterococcus florum]|uniref:Microcompartment protein PduM n=1 Tax=Enterococcus florum TaxID=2480627 RepID=A0A4P5PAV4_9ENTE|nr:PduM family microcompartment protein [Enterococcus florum]GCF95237.1 hypothetical protein NRIC_31280 [Enterococcus florum]
MEKLIEAIVKILVERQTKELSLSCKDFKTDERTDRDFIQHQTIHLHQVGAIQLAKLARMDDEDPLTVWLLSGLEFGCDVVLHLGFSAICLIPNELFEWPIQLNINQNKRLRVVPNKIITYSDVALLEQTDLLIRFRQQQVTAVAEDYLKKHKIQQIVRF